MAEVQMSTRRQTALAIIDAYNSWDTDRIMSLRTDDCVMTIGPKSLGVPPMSNEPYRTFFSSMTPNIQNFTLTIKTIVEDPIANKIVIWADSTADTAAGKGSYSQEYFLMFEFNDEGDKASRILEFVDSTKSKENRAMMKTGSYNE